MTQTALEWLETQLLNKMNGTPIVDRNLFEQAKEMEKQHIIDAYNTGDHNVLIYRKGLQYFEDKFTEQ